MRLCHVNADRYGTDVYRLRCNAFNLQEQLNKMKSDSTSERDQLGWQMPMYAVLAAVIVFLPSLISSKTEVLYIFVIVPRLALISICVLLYAAVSRRLPTSMMVATFFVVSIQEGGPGRAHASQWRLEAHRMGWLGMGRSRLLGFSCFRSHRLALRTGPKRSIRQAQWNTLRGFLCASHGLTLVYRFFRRLRRSIFLGQLQIDAASRSGSSVTRSPGKRGGLNGSTQR